MNASCDSTVHGAAAPSAKFDRTRSSELAVTENVTEERLRTHLVADISHGAISGAHWFRHSELWLRTQHGYNNPLNWGSVHSELAAIKEHNREIESLLRARDIVFFGIGVGDTEMAVVDAASGDNGNGMSGRIVGFDVNADFLAMFAMSLRLRALEHAEPQPDFVPVRALFEDVPAFNSAKHDTRLRAFVCLGSTIGNYRNLREIFGVFTAAAANGDVLLVSYQLPDHLETVYNKYVRNPFYYELITSCLTKAQREQLSWRLDKEGSSVEAWSSKVQVFRSVKYSTEKVGSCAQKLGWVERFLFVDQHRNVALHAFGKS